LIAAAGWISRHLTWGDRDDPYGRALHWLSAAIMGTLGTTLVATLATGPFSTYHFQNLNPYGLLGNAVTLPLVSLVIMPGAVIGMLLYPFGLDGPIWWAMGLAVEAMLKMSRWIGGFERSTIVVPAYGPGALALFAEALILLTIPASALRWLGLLPAVLGCWLAVRAKPFDLYLDRDGAGAAIRGASGRLVVVGRSPVFVIEQWLKADGDARPGRDRTLRDGARCDPLGCVVESGREVVAFVADRRAFSEDCARATVVVSRFRAPETCRARTIVDGSHLRARGATAIRWSEAGPQVVSARSPGDNRPWQPRVEPPTERKIFRPARGSPRDDPPGSEDAAPSSDEPG
jgi:competence protein ComEC